MGGEAKEKRRELLYRLRRIKECRAVGATVVLKGERHTIAVELEGHEAAEAIKGFLSAYFKAYLDRF
jgi:hypothetical protein